MIEGRVWKFGDHINTDLIIPGRCLDDYSKENLAAHVMEDVDPQFAKQVRKGDIIVAGCNFGCGSSREQAPLALKFAGVGAVVAGSFARIFFRNAINIGLPILECPEAADGIAAGDIVEVDFDSGVIRDRTTAKEFKAQPFPEFLQGIIAAGGLMNHIASKQPHGGTL